MTLLERALLCAIVSLGALACDPLAPLKPEPSPPPSTTLALTGDEFLVLLEFGLECPDRRDALAFRVPCDRNPTVDGPQAYCRLAPPWRSATFGCGYQPPIRDLSVPEPVSLPMTRAKRHVAPVGTAVSGSSPRLWDGTETLETVPVETTVPDPRATGETTPEGEQTPGQDDAANNSKTGVTADDSPKTLKLAGQRDWFAPGPFYFRLEPRDDDRAILLRALDVFGPCTFGAVGPPAGRPRWPKDRGVIACFFDFGQDNPNRPFRGFRRRRLGGKHPTGIWLDYPPDLERDQIEYIREGRIDDPAAPLPRALVIETELLSPRERLIAREELGKVLKLGRLVETGIEELTD